MTHAIGIERAELLPCPFCGEECERGSRKINPWARCPTVGCAGRSMPIVQLDSPESIAAWNRRAALKPSGDAGELCDRLQSHAKWMDSDAPVVFDSAIFSEAADRITTLERQLATAREALDHAAEAIDQVHEDHFGHGHVADSQGRVTSYPFKLVLLAEIRDALTPGVSDAE